MKRARRMDTFRAYLTAVFILEGFAFIAEGASWWWAALAFATSAFAFALLVFGLRAR